MFIRGREDEGVEYIISHFQWGMKRERDIKFFLASLQYCRVRPTSFVKVTSNKQ